MDIYCLYGTNGEGMNEIFVVGTFTDCMLKCNTLLEQGAFFEQSVLCPYEFGEDINDVWNKYKWVRSVNNNGLSTITVYEKNKQVRHLNE